MQQAVETQPAPGHKPRRRVTHSLTTLERAMAQAPDYPTWRDLAQEH
jgi:hypothetical protein